jgi:hypothetical protein
LNGSIDSSQTTLVVDDGSVFPSTGDFRIIIEGEYLLCTSRSTNTLTVVRGIEGSTVASHGNGAEVVQIVTVGGLAQTIADTALLHGYSPPLARLRDGSGNVVDSSDFTWENQGSATASDQVGTILVRTPSAGGENLRMLTLSSGSAPFAYIAAFQPCLLGEFGALSYMFLGLRNASSQKNVLLAVLADDSAGSKFSVYKFNSTTSNDSAPINRRGLQLSGLIWIKAEDDNTNIKLHISADGMNWIQVFSEARTNFITGGADQIVFGLANIGTGIDATVRLCHLSKV